MLVTMTYISWSSEFASYLEDYLMYEHHTPEPFYNTVHYNTVLVITQIKVGPQMAIQDSFSYTTYAFYSRYNTVWIANTDIGLNPKDSVIKRLWCTLGL